jgi:hypothetical protein
MDGCFSFSMLNQFVHLLSPLLSMQDQHTSNTAFFTPLSLSLSLFLFKIAIARRYRGRSERVKLQQQRESGRIDPSQEGKNTFAPLAVHAFVHGEHSWTQQLRRLRTQVGGGGSGSGQATLESPDLQRERMGDDQEEVGERKKNLLNTRKHHDDHHLLMPTTHHPRQFDAVETTAHALVYQHGTWVQANAATMVREMNNARKE